MCNFRHNIWHFCFIRNGWRWSTDNLPYTIFRNPTAASTRHKSYFLHTSCNFISCNLHKKKSDSLENSYSICNFRNLWSNNWLFTINVYRRLLALKTFWRIATIYWCKRVIQKNKKRVVKNYP